MKLIPVENTDLEISFEVYPVDMVQVTKVRIDSVREKLKTLEADGKKALLLRLAELMIDIVENWDKGSLMSKMNKAILCIQKANVCLAQHKQQLLNKKKKK